MAIGLVDRQRNLCGFGIFENPDKAVAALVPEMDAEVPITNFKDVLRHYSHINAAEDEQDRVGQLVFKWTEDRLLEVHAKGERRSKFSISIANPRPVAERLAKQSRRPPDRGGPRARLLFLGAFPAPKHP